MASRVHQPWNFGVVMNSVEEEEGQCFYKFYNYGDRSRDVLLWQEYFRDPSLWWDNRSSKVDPGYPDFKHKASKQPLWIDGRHTPWWVCQELSRSSLELSAHPHDRKLFRKQEILAYDRSVFCDDECSAFVALLRACAKNKDLYTGTRAHDEIATKGLLDRCSDALVTMYAKCGALAKAQELLDIHNSMNVFTWTALITGYAQQGRGEDALNCFEKMRGEGLSPDAVTFACILKACGSTQAVDKGKQIHEEIARQGLLGNDIVLGNALVDMYAKCGALEKAQQVLEELPSRDVVSWNALITGYAQQRQGEQALNCFERMRHEGLSPNVVTFACILKACGSIGAVEKGEQIHDEITRQGLHSTVLCTALVDMYAKCGALTKAQHIIGELPSRDVVSWNALIAGYAQQGQGEKALECFAQMQREGLSPNAVTYTSILKACSSIRAADMGEQILDEIRRQGLLENNVVLGTAVVDMYARCGALWKAEKMLEELPSQDIAPWNALISGYAQQGQSEQALNCFRKVHYKGLSPDAITFSCVLNACSHLGLVDDGYMYFTCMSRSYGVKPDIEHYTCMVDLFGRAGHLDKAVEVIQEMPSCNDRAVWSALLGACHKWGDVDVGRWAYEHLVQIDSNDSGAYVLMANIYAAAGMQEEAAKIEALRSENNAWKKLGHSWWMDLSGSLHTCIACH